MSCALIGYTGFVGGTVLRQSPFDALFNSANIESIAGREFDLVVCAGAPGQKWRANQDPITDRSAIDRLCWSLGSLRASFVVLLSTVDVFATPTDVDEDSPIDASRQQPYGRNRRELERFIAARFPSLIVRLPGLFGEGLRKNIVYDFLHDNAVGAVDARSVFQFYDMSRLWADVGTARAAGLSLVHFATEPVSVAEVAAEAFDRAFDQVPAASVPARYDMRSKHAGVFGGRGGYLYSRADVLDGLRRFVAMQRSRLNRKQAA
jgi:nucleoside-diphosphate-sugar epimerase